MRHNPPPASLVSRDEQRTYLPSVFGAAWGEWCGGISPVVESAGMKPRFSILGLLGMTAYLAVNAAAYSQPEGRMPLLALVVDAVVFFAMIAVAAGATCSSSIFARATLLGFLFFYMLQVMEPIKLWDPHATRYLSYQNILASDTTQGEYARGLIIEKFIRAGAGAFCGIGAIAYHSIKKRE